jgi:hypothetical protein
MFRLCGLRYGVLSTVFACVQVEVSLAGIAAIASDSVGRSIVLWVLILPDSHILDILAIHFPNHFP